MYVCVRTDQGVFVFVHMSVCLCSNIRVYVCVRTYECVFAFVNMSVCLCSYRRVGGVCVRTDECVFVPLNRCWLKLNNLLKLFKLIS